MKILITGVTGFIGSNTAIALMKDGYKVYGVDNICGFRQIKLFRLDQLRNYKKFVFSKFDLNNKSALVDLFRHNKIDMVFHFASRTSIVPSIKRPLEYVRANISSTINLCEVLKEYKIDNVIFSSSSSVYGNAPLPFKESYKDISPINPYGITKLSIEHFLKYYHKMFGMNITVLRYFNVYGPAGRPDLSINRFISNILRGKEIIIYGDGSQRRDFTYIDDVVRANLLAMKKIKGYRLYNIASGKNYSINEILYIIEKIIGKRVEVEYYNIRSGELNKTLGNIDKAKRDLGYKPEVDIYSGIERSVNWYKKNIEKIE